jgi:hypothetical protein
MASLKHKPEENLRAGKDINLLPSGLCAQSKMMDWRAVSRLPSALESTRSVPHITGDTQRLIGIALVLRLCGARGLNRRSGFSPCPED